MLGTLQQCPGCKTKFQVLPTSSDHVMPCSVCKNKINVKSSTKSNSQRKEIEVLLFLTYICVFANIWNSIYALVASIAFNVSVLFILYMHSFKKQIFNANISLRLEQTLLRLKIYPYEYVLILGWIILYFLRISNSQYRELTGALLLLLSVEFTLNARNKFRKPLIVKVSSKYVEKFTQASSTPEHLLDSIPVFENEESIEAQAETQSKMPTDTQLTALELEKVKKLKEERDIWKLETKERYKKWISTEKNRLLKKKSNLF